MLRSGDLRSLAWLAFLLAVLHRAKMADEPEVERESKRLRVAELGDDDSVAVGSADGLVWRWPRAAALRAGTLKDWIENTYDEGTFPTQLPAVALRMLRETCTYDGNKANSPLASLALDETIDLMSAANFLEATGVWGASPLSINPNFFMTVY